MIPGGFPLSCIILILVYSLLFAWALKRFTSVIRYRRGLLRSNIELHKWNRGIQTAVFLSVVLATFGRALCCVLIAMVCTPESSKKNGNGAQDQDVCNLMITDGKSAGQFGRFGYLIFIWPGFFIDVSYILLFNLLMIVWMRTKAVQEMVSLDIVRPRLIYSTIGCCVLYFLTMLSIIIWYEAKQAEYDDGGYRIIITQGVVVIVLCLLAVLGLITMRCFIRDVDYRSPCSQIRFRKVAKTFTWWTLARVLYGIGMVSYNHVSDAFANSHGLLVMVIVIATFFVMEILPCVLIIQRGFFHVLVQIDDMEEHDGICLSRGNIGNDEVASSPGLASRACRSASISSCGQRRLTQWANRDFLRNVVHVMTNHEYLAPRDTKRLGMLQVANVPPPPGSSDVGQEDVTIRILCERQLPTRHVIMDCVHEARALTALSHPNVVPIIAFVHEAPLMQSWRTQSACWIVTGSNAARSLHTYLHSSLLYSNSTCSTSHLGRESYGRRAWNAWSRYWTRSNSGIIRDPTPNNLPRHARQSLWDALAVGWPWDPAHSEQGIRNEKLMKRVGLFRQLVDGLTYLHECDVAHGHLSPHNILVEGTPCDGSPPTLRIADVGFHGLKRYESLMGHYDMRNPWSAPEILAGTQKNFSRWSDIYALGLILWEMITSEEPFAGLTLGAITKAVNDKQRPELPLANTAFAVALNSVIHGCWQHEPSQRMSCPDILGEINDIEVRFRKK